MMIRATLEAGPPSYSKSFEAPSGLLPSYRNYRFWLYVLPEPHAGVIALYWGVIRNALQPASSRDSVSVSASAEALTLPTKLVPSYSTRAMECFCNCLSVNSLSLHEARLQGPSS
jgi:hypothetical protein